MPTRYRLTLSGALSFIALETGAISTLSSQGDETAKEVMNALTMHNAIGGRAQRDRVIDAVTDYAKKTMEGDDNETPSMPGLRSRQPLLRGQSS